MDGGKLIGTGTVSCVFSPSFRCSKKDKSDPSKKRISKIIYHSKSKQVSEREYKINQKIRELPSYEKWALTYDNYCKSPSSEEILMADEKGYEDCFHNKKIIMTQDFPRVFDENGYMLTGDKGSMNFTDYFMDTFYKKNDTSFLILMDKLETIFIALREMGKYKIVHNDIKAENIVLHNGTFKLIDFGISAPITQLKHFKDRSLYEFNSKRIYMIYPLEYIYSNVTPRDKLKDDVYTRIDIDQYISIHSLFKRKNDLNKLVNNLTINKQDFKEMIKKNDVYSVGILIPRLFSILQVSMKSPVIIDFFNLFQKMTEPLYKDRISADQSCLEFQGLLQKYILDYKQGSIGRKQSKKKRSQAPRRRRVTPRRRRVTPRRRRVTPRRRRVSSQRRKESLRRRLVTPRKGGGTRKRN